MNSDRFFLLKALEYKASRVIFCRYRMNRFELQTLCSLASYFVFTGKRVVSRKIFCDWLGLSYKIEKKTYGYIAGLSRLGAIHVLTWRNQKPGTGNSLAISLFGARVLGVFWNALEKLEGIELSNSDYSRIMVEDIPDGYSVTKLGAE